MRFFQCCLILFIFIIGAFIALLGSHVGNQYIIKKLNNAELPLHLVLEEGSLFHQARWQKIDWQGELFQFSITDLAYDIDLTCLLSAEVCVNKLNASSVSYSMALDNKPQTLLGIDLGEALTRIAKFDDSTSKNNEQLDILGLISVSNIDIRDINVVVANTSVTVDRLEGTVNLSGRDITVIKLVTHNAYVQVLTASSGKQVTKGVINSQPMTSAEETNKQLDIVTDLLNEFELYQVSIPLRVDVNDAKLIQSKLHVNDLSLDFNSIDLTGFIDSGEVRIDKLIVDMPQADTSIKGQIVLQKDYPLYATVNTTLKQPALLKQLAVDVNATGSLDSMTLAIDTSGPVNTHVDALLAPLRPALPFTINANWQQLSWPLLTPAYINSADGKLSMQGNLDDYTIAVSGLLDINNTPLLDLDAKGKGTLQGLSFSRINAKTLSGQVSASGQLKWTDGITVKSKVAAKGIQLDKFWPDIQLQPNGNAAVDFNLMPEADNDWQLAIYDIDVGADFKGYPLTLQGKLTLDQDLYWNLDGFSLSRGNDAVKLDGIINEQFKIAGEIDIKALTPYLAESKGSAFGYFTIIGQKTKPWFNFDLFIDDVLFKGNKLQRADLTGKISLSESPEGTISLTGEELMIGEQVINKVALDYIAGLNSNSISVSIENEKNNAKLEINSFLQDNIWQGNVTKGRINSEYGNWIIDPNVNFTFSNQDDYLSIAQHCWNEKVATLCLGFEGNLEKTDNFEFKLQDYDINKLGLEKEKNLEIEGLLNIISKVTWRKGTPLQLTSKVEITDASLLIYNEEESSIANFDTLTMDVGLDESRLIADININSHELGGMTSDIRVDDIFGKRELSGDIHIIDIDLAFIEPLIYQVDVLNGVVSGAGIVDGTLDKPEIIGQFNVNNGYLAGDELPVTLENFQFNIESSGQKANITGSANSGKGLAKVVGNVTWGNEFYYEMLFHGDNFEFDDNKGVKLHFSPKIKIKGNKVGAKISGDIVIPYARIKVEQLPQTAIQVSTDVIIVDAEHVNEKQNYPLDVEVNIKLLDDVKIDSFGLESNIIGDVNLILDEDGNLFSDGMLQFKEGRYRSFGQDLYIRKGQIIFSGSIDNPYINVEAIRNTELTEDNVIVGVRLIGPVKKPLFTIFSEPEMPQTRMISYLLRGRDINSEDETSQDVVITTMLVGSSLGQGKDVISFLGDTLGVKDFAIDTRGQGNDTRVEVSGYVLPGVQIRYGIGLFSALSEVVVRYEIIPKLYIELATGVDSAVDLYYKFSR
ncbi:Hypothetical outer membrane protein [Moritella viscosa]|uniref:Hypothetical outer membrane protein n=1 Tax=Moritella viscosa TaxID=80854 RepID=A0A1L0AH96_9GAMM|nr:translocation/assembly module TamB domain-containing protein [Moritella viscosa]SGZ14563.1 Hypothetical outer membrane protein [Moritella viscosa]SHO14060.1 Hypothetical outer membrane protein [Moritella viscosa]SHO17210.1 Hypothetical outer membrane protein [Moritella viscosa]SHO18751.1 Hypothetical outer membrane protein [Moritella viscosa]